MHYAVACQVGCQIEPTFASILMPLRISLEDQRGRGESQVARHPRLVGELSAAIPMRLRATE